MALWIKDSNEESGKRPGAGLYDSIGRVQEIYDDQERVIGTWFGKPLYRKVFTWDKSSLTSGETQKTWSSLTVDKFVTIRGIIGNGHPLVCYHNASEWASSVYNVSSNGCWFYIGTSRFNAMSSGIILILEYTKVGD